MRSRRPLRFCSSLLFLFSVLFACSPASAQADLNYPNKTIRIVVGFTPGGAPDLTARVIAQKLSALWGQPVIVENRAGAGSAMAAEHVAQSAPDGYTLFSITDAHAVVAALNFHLPYDPVKDFAPITITSTASNWVLVSPSLHVKTLAELIAYAKANPGKLNFPSAGVGSFSHFGTAMFNDRVGIEAQHIPFKGIPEALIEISAGRAHFMVAPVSISSALVRDGKLIPVAVTSKERLAAYPDIPTVAESGYPGFEKLTMSALIAPAHTPPEIIAKLNKAISNIIDQDDVKQQWAKIGVDPAHDTPEELQAIISNEVTTFTEAAQRAHITAE